MTNQAANHAQTHGGADPAPADTQPPAAAGEVYNRIAMLRVERGISRRQLAEALGVHYQTVGYLERGEFAPSLHLALRLARFFGVPVEIIFSIEPFPRLGAVVRPAEPGGRTEGG